MRGSRATEHDSYVRTNRAIEEDAELDQVETGFTVLRREKPTSRNTGHFGGRPDDQDVYRDVDERMIGDDQQPSTFVRLRKDQVSAKPGSAFMAEGDGGENGFTRLRKGRAPNEWNSDTEGDFAGDDDERDLDGNHNNNNLSGASFIRLQGSRPNGPDSRIRVDRALDEDADLNHNNIGFTMLRRERALARSDQSSLGDQGENQGQQKDAQLLPAFIKLRKDQMSPTHGSPYSGEESDENEGGFTHLRREDARRVRKADVDDRLGYGDDDDYNRGNQSDASFINLRGAPGRRQEGPGEDTDLSEGEAGYTMLHRERASNRQAANTSQSRLDDQDGFNDDQQPSTFIKLRKDQSSAKDGFMSEEPSGGSFTKLRRRRPQQHERNGDFEDDYGDHDGEHDSNRLDASFIMLQGGRRQRREGRDPSHAYTLGEDANVSQGEAGFTSLRRERASSQSIGKGARVIRSRLGSQEEDEDGLQASNFIKLRKDRGSAPDRSDFISEGSGIEGGFTRLRRGVDANEQSSTLEGELTGAHGLNRRDGDVSFVDLHTQIDQAHGNRPGQEIDPVMANSMARDGPVSQKFPAGNASTSLNMSGQSLDGQNGMFGNLFRHSMHNRVWDNAHADSSTILRDLELSQSTGTIQAKVKLSSTDGIAPAAMGSDFSSLRPGLDIVGKTGDAYGLGGQDWNRSVYADFHKHQVNSKVNSMLSQPKDESAVIRDLWLRQLDQAAMGEPKLRSSMLEAPFISDSLALVEPYSSRIRTNRNDPSLIGQVVVGHRQLYPTESVLPQHLQSPFSNRVVDYRNQDASLLSETSLNNHPSGRAVGQAGLRDSSSHSLFEKMSFMTGISETGIEFEEDEEEDNLSLLEASFEAKANFEDVRMGIFARRPRKGNTKVERRGESKVMHAQERRGYDAPQEFVKPPPPPPLLPPTHNPLPPPL